MIIQLNLNHPLRKKKKISLESRTIVSSSSFRPRTLNQATRFHGVSGIATMRWILIRGSFQRIGFAPAGTADSTPPAGRGLAEFAHMRPGSLRSLPRRTIGRERATQPQRLGNSRRFIIVPQSACADTTRPAVSTHHSSCIPTCSTDKSRYNFAPND